MAGEPVRQPLPKQTSNDVGPAARDDADDQAHRPRWIGLRPRGPRDSRDSGGARGEMEKISAGKFHFEPPSRFTSFDHLVGASAGGGGRSWRNGCVLVHPSHDNLAWRVELRF